ncbi:uncharacterized protein BDZ83DRAFT_415694 [Colletotrichum acutatum]|uniref:Uncharacterized protein n=1 Tax=Glomerella acutata TaxID=27357 RepID=A0AAD8UJ36_GLOAC|nr:uncharacterized protein BDZ83DRAFT_415694 [Colletotrichum acutatum]KAK1722674.1 hypothetical protein BDZ83DRAFT_415694 [Colletotrichum acutatum]
MLRARGAKLARGEQNIRRAARPLSDDPGLTMGSFPVVVDFGTNRADGNLRPKPVSAALPAEYRDMITDYLPRLPDRLTESISPLLTRGGNEETASSGRISNLNGILASSWHRLDLPIDPIMELLGSRKPQKITVFYPPVAAADPVLPCVPVSICLKGEVPTEKKCQERR